MELARCFLRLSFLRLSFLRLRKGASATALLVILPGCSANLLVAVDDDSEPATPELSQVYAVSDRVIALRFDTGQVIHGEQVSYLPEPKDQIKQAPRATWLIRDDQTIGSLVGADQAILHTLDKFVEAPLDRDWLQRPQSYDVVLESPALPAPQASTAAETVSTQAELNATQPIAVFYKSKPTDMAQGQNHADTKWPIAHTVYLKLPQSLTAGQRYQIRFPGSSFDPVTFDYDPMVNPSEAVHVSHLGFRPDDVAKVGFLSTWMGSGGGLAYPENLSFWLVDEATDEPVYQGKTQLSVAQTEAEDDRDRNYNGTDVYRMDFSDFQTVGTYRLCVDQVGCSFPFEIADDVWARAFYVSARGFYHQRSGIPLSEPYTDYYQPRSFHPEDGVEIFQAGVSLMETTMGIGDRNAFEALVETRTESTVPDAWGGYFDAGDWDRRIQHLNGARLLIELVDFFPEHFQRVELNLPESDNALPDVLDEALWGLDLFRRLQTEDGGIRGGIESVAHPKRGEASWQESLTVMAYAPDSWSSYFYAGVAAYAARILQNYDLELAKTYQDSALRAMAYAEKTFLEWDETTRQTLDPDIADKRNLAALELYQLTADPQWHQLFLETTAFKIANQPARRWKHYNQRDAAFIYTSLSNRVVDDTVQAHARQALLTDADTIVRQGQSTGFNWTKQSAGAPVGWGNSFGNPQAIQLLRAYQVTADKTYLEAAILATQFSAGANPDNMVYTTGLGHRSPQNPDIKNQRVTRQLPPPGITVYGPLDAQHFNDYWLFPFLEGSVYPDIETMPTIESYLDVYLYPAVTEFTLHDSIAPTAYAWGYLAARDSR